MSPRLWYVLFCHHVATVTLFSVIVWGEIFERETEVTRVLARQQDGAARLSRRDFFALFDLDLWPFDLILLGGRDVTMDYLCAKFGDFTLSRFGFIVQTDRQTESQRQMIAILTRLPSMWVTGIIMYSTHLWVLRRFITQYGRCLLLLVCIFRKFCL